MGVLAAAGVKKVHHYTPLHYLPFIARAKAILNKPSLKKAGFKSSHFRSMSKKQDVERGFSDYAHLTLDAAPGILKAKLAAGFPHIAIVVPVETVDGVAFSLCRFNVAMTRKLRRGRKRGFSESATNGRYYPGHEIPIARDDSDQTAMLVKHLSEGTMIEVLVHGDLDLPDHASVVCFSDADAGIATNLLATLGCPWTVQTLPPPGPYPRDSSYVEAVSDFISKAQNDPSWRGNGLEFDRLKPK
jgi:hypothetical protein